MSDCAEASTPSTPSREATTYHGPLRCIHVLGHPDKPLDLRAAPADAQVFNCHNFCKLLSHVGLPFVYYGLPDSELPAGGDLADTGPPTGAWEYRNSWHVDYTSRLDQSLAKRLSGRTAETDLVVSLYGCAHADLTVPETHDLPVVEAMVGYDHCWAPYRVFPSYAHQNVIYSDPAPAVQESIWFDTVIPHFVDAADYWIDPGPKEYALYLGRDAPDKGVRLARDVCAKASVPLRLVHDGVSGTEKTELVARSVAVFAPTIYLEPFGYVAVEAQMCGVPAITTDWGAFAETVEHGKTGFRCRTEAEFLRALEHAVELDPDTIRSRAVSLYAVEAVAPAYMAYFDFVRHVHLHGGYYAENACRQP